ncbi:MAG: STAS domain-containing protein [candidate division Zixibacteria bacterium]|nr:STAS domain-containing protein [candidate division Zixibacteria bacterium]MBU1471414.1 STAS domain-containing protein [candidate division Zixibacteria bacterium]MBU2626811.1 STAS domain-containing protein [candidate division Zixibacteria bacterium]
MISRIFPFLSWFENYTGGDARRDVIGGMTVALVLIPQSMAYAQLAGLPAYYGLYAAFLPPVVAALFGSSRQLATGPVAVVSLMTATALEPLATAGSESFIAYAIMLALFVGIFQFLLGAFKLGLVVNFLSHPVVSGFTNAAALIIATSQLSKLFGVTVDSAEHHYETIYNVFREALFYTHWPTLALAVLAFAIMYVMRRFVPRLPNVLVAVLITTLVSWSTGFEHSASISLDQIASTRVRSVLDEFNGSTSMLETKTAERVARRTKHDDLLRSRDEIDLEVLDIEHQIAILDAEIAQAKGQIAAERGWLRRCLLEENTDSLGRTIYLERSEESSSRGADGSCWRFRISNGRLDLNKITLAGGGAVVGTIPQGLPDFKAPRIDFSVAFDLLPIAVVISLLGFMEAISIAKAMAARTGQRLNANQELMGQGLANIIGSFSQSYAVSGSFSRSAVNIQAGAVTGVSNAVSSLVVVIVLLFFTPLLYHLPQSVLAAIIMMAVVGLINVKSFIHAWRAQKYDGAIGVTTFIFTLTFAPHLDRGIMVGVVLSLLLYLVRNMKPAIAMLSLHPDGTYRNRRRFGLKQCPYVAVIRYAGSLIFSNVDYLDSQVLDAVRSMPKLNHVLIVGNGMNEIDASGVDALSVLIDRLHGQGLQFSISGFNDNVLDVLNRTGLVAKIGENNIYRNVSRAVDGIWERAHANVEEEDCPIRVSPMIPFEVSAKTKQALMKKFLSKPDNQSSIDAHNKDNNTPESL